MAKVTVTYDERYAGPLKVALHRVMGCIDFEPGIARFDCPDEDVEKLHESLMQRFYVKTFEVISDKAEVGP